MLSKVQGGFLLALQDSSKGHSTLMEVTETARKQAEWWISHARAAMVESPITDPRPCHRMDPVRIFTDAAGGDPMKMRNEQVVSSLQRLGIMSPGHCLSGKIGKTRRE